MSSSSCTSPFTYTDIVGTTTSYTVSMGGEYVTPAYTLDSTALYYGEYADTFRFIFEPWIDTLYLNINSPSTLDISVTSCPDTSANYISISSSCQGIMNIRVIDSVNYEYPMNLLGYFTLNYSQCYIPYDSTTGYFESEIPFTLSYSEENSSSTANYYTITWSLPNTLIATSNSSNYPSFTLVMNSATLLFCSDPDPTEGWINTLLSMTLTVIDTATQTTEYLTNFTITCPVGYVSS